jgi:hypothetical protein
MAKQTKLDRILIFSRKIIRTQLMGLNSAAIKGRFVGPRVLANSVPKAGTNLMERVLSFMPGMRMAPYRTLMEWDVRLAHQDTRLLKLGRGQFINAHLPAYPHFLELVDSLAIKSLFLIRDPRDVVISNFKYVNEIDITHPSHKGIANLANDHERLTATIIGLEDVVSSVEDLWGRFEGWRSNPHTLVVKYEDLIGAKGGGDSSVQLSTIASIASHIGIQLSAEKIQYIADNIYSTKASTFRKGGTGNWKNVFTEEHVKLFKEQTGDLLIRLGYETSDDWGVN